MQSTAEMRTSKVVKPVSLSEVMVLHINNLFMLIDLLRFPVGWATS